MNVLIDGVFFQLASSGIGRVWTSLLGELASKDGLNLSMLDRGNAPEIPGVRLVEFPSYTMTYTAADSLLIQDLCDKLDIDVFTSSYYTSATRTPQVQVVYDMIPELLGFDMSARAWKEKKLALCYSSHFACISETTRRDLLGLYPEISATRAIVTYCGVDNTIFNTTQSLNSNAFRASHGLTKPYFLVVGSREQHKSYKNVQLLFEASKIDQAADYDIVCVGGEDAIDTSWLRGLPTGLNAKRIELDDNQLAAAYSGAIALVYPSLYEGFGMPVVEAMATGCPVITTRLGALAEIAGEAALVISGKDPLELLLAMDRVRQPAVRESLVVAGEAQAGKFRWDNSAELFLELLLMAKTEGDDPSVREFHRRWARLRLTQASVDVGLD